MAFWGSFFWCRFLFLLRPPSLLFACVRTVWQAQTCVRICYLCCLPVTIPRLLHLLLALLADTSWTNGIRNPFHVARSRRKNQLCFPRLEFTISSFFLCKWRVEFVHAHAACFALIDDNQMEYFRNDVRYLFTVNLAGLVLVNLHVDLHNSSSSTG